MTPWTSTSAFRAPISPTTGLASPYLDQSTFTITNLKSPYSTQRSHIAIQINSVGITTGPSAVANGTASMIGITIGDNTASNFNVFDAHGSFIVANKSNVTLVNNVFQNTQTYTVSGGSLFGGSAVKHSAVYTVADVMHTMLNMPAANVSSGNRFWNCHQGIQLDKTYLFWLENAIFRSTQSSTNTTGFLPGNSGIYASTNNFDYYIANSEFTNIKSGINIPISTGLIAPQASWNTPPVIGIFAHRIRIYNNTFSAGSGSNSYMDRAVDMTCPNSVPWQYSGSFVVPNVSVTPFTQAFSITNNTLTNIFTGISVNGSQGFQVDISKNTISLKDNSTPQFGIQLLNCNPTSNASIGKNLITGNTASFSAASATANAQSALVFCGNNGYGIFSPSVSCNILKQANSGFVFENANQQAVWATNEMQLPMKKGMVLQNSGVIGVQGGVSAAISNTWTGGTWSGVNNYHTYTSASQASLSVLWVRNVAGSIPNNSAGIPFPQSYAAVGNYTYVGSGSGDYNCSDFTNNKVLHIPLSGEFSTTELFYMSKTALYRFLNFNDSIVSSGNATATSFYSSQAGGSIEKFTQVEKYLYQGNFSTALSLNAEVAATNTIETNYKSYYTLYAAYAANDFQHTNSTDNTNLYNLAMLCPGTNGACIYQAIALYNRVYKTILIPSCSNIGAKIAHSENEILNQIDEEQWNVNLYPNPASYQLTFLTNGEESQDLVVTITDLSGRNINSLSIKTKDFISKLDIDLTNGAYLIHITNRNHETCTKKLLISK